MNKKLKYYFLLSLFTLNISGSNAIAMEVEPDAEIKKQECVRIDWDKDVEMFNYGTITLRDENQKEVGHFNVHFIPGACNILKDAGESWCDAGSQFAKFADCDFWRRDIWGSFSQSLEFAWNTTKDHGIGQICDDFNGCITRFNSVAITEFGSLGTKCGAVAGMGCSLVGRPIISVCGAGLGVLGAVIVPTLQLMWPIVAGGAKALIPGTVVPVVKMVWNGVTWVATQAYSEIPKNVDNIAVTWVASKE